MPLPLNLFNQCTILVERPLFYCNFYPCLSTRVTVLYDVLNGFTRIGLLCDIVLCLHIMIQHPPLP